MSSLACYSVAMIPAISRAFGSSLACKIPSDFLSNLPKHFLKTKNDHNHEIRLHFMVWQRFISVEKLSVLGNTESSLNIQTTWANMLYDQPKMVYRG